MLGVAFQIPGSETFLQQWEFALSHFKPDAIYGVRGEGELRGSKLPITEIRSADDLPDDPLIVFQPQNGLHFAGSTSLVELEHAERAIWWFGSDARHFDPAILGKREPDRVVYIPTDSGDQMYSFQAYAVSAWDRRVKRGDR